MSVGTAGPFCERKMSHRMSDRMSEHMSDRMPERTSEWMPGRKLKLYVRAGITRSKVYIIYNCYGAAGVV